MVSYTYDSWGKHDGKPELKDANYNITQQGDIKGTLAATVGVKNPYRYRGYRYDTETGLYYLNSRYYNPEWGRFINADAIAGSTRELLSHNVFAYCKNNPVNMSDPDGYLPRKNVDWYDKTEMQCLSYKPVSDHVTNGYYSLLTTQSTLLNNCANDYMNYNIKIKDASVVRCSYDIGIMYLTYRFIPANLKVAAFVTFSTGTAISVDSNFNNARIMSQVRLYGQIASTLPIYLPIKNASITLFILGKVHEDFVNHINRLFDYFKSDKIIRNALLRNNYLKLREKIIQGGINDTNIFNNPRNNNMDFCI